MLRMNDVQNTVMLNKFMLAKVSTCSKDESDDLFNAEEPNDESYHAQYN